jgi:hypothetical protein
MASSGAYVNVTTEEEIGPVASAYGANYARLLHLNQNIRP